MSSTGPRFLTPGDVRAIPSDQWELWVQDDGVPWPDFAPRPDVMMCAWTISVATYRRMEAAKRGTTNP